MGRPLKMGGNAWQYLIESVTPDAGEIRLGADSARYYAAPGTPPGRFCGRGLDGLGTHPGAVKVGDQVSPEALARMLGQLADPVTEKTLGRAPAATRKAPVAGFDLTFSVPKSVSVAWAMADRGTKTVIEDICAQAYAEVLTWAEDRVFRTRTGAQGVRSEGIRGVVASAWMHYESRDGDPQLHHHVVVLNRAQTASDGRWRTLDSRGLHTWVVALSERHVGVVEDLLTERFGVAWRETPTVAGRDVTREVEGTPVDLIAEFSRRTQAIEAVIARKTAEFASARGRKPTPVEAGRIHRAAWGETRRAKLHRSLAEMTEEWTERARPWVCDEPASWVASLAGRSDLPALRSDDLTDAMLDDVARAALARRSETRSVFSVPNIYADVERELHGVLFARGERARVAERAVALALSMAVKLTPPELTHVPERFRSPDGSSQFAPAAVWAYTTADLLDAEARLLAASRNGSGPRLGFETVAAVCEAALPGRPYGLGVDQAVAVEQIATSGRVLDVLVGPAGTGKTTTLAGLLAAWEAEHGAGSVRGLAPSASAAAALADELGIATDNTAKWLTELERADARRAEIERLQSRLGGRLGEPARLSLTQRIAEAVTELARWSLAPGSLLVVDEASLAGTFALDHLVAHAAEAGAKVLLVGDWAQLDAVDAGGAFGLLVEDRAPAPQLSEVHRFRAGWERRASVELRVGRPEALDAYLAHDRVAAGNRAEMLEAAYLAWKADAETGKASLMIAQDIGTVAELNRRARSDRVAAGAVAPDGITLADGSVAGPGDVVVTRRNDRRLRTPDGGWVRNRDRWVVTATHEDGSMTLRRAEGAGLVVLPASYVDAHVELGYACTAYSAQGRNVETAHAVVGVGMTREALYVAATRASESNRLYVDVEPEPAGADMAHGAPERLEAREVLLAVAARSGVDVSAHQAAAAEWEKAAGFEQLVKEHQALVAAAAAERWESVLDVVGLATEVLAKARDSLVWPEFLGALRDAENRGLEVEAALPELATGRPIGPEQDPAAVLRARLWRWEQASGGHWQPRRGLVAGIAVRAGPIADADLARAVREREEAMAARARALAEGAVRSGRAWTRPLGDPPPDPPGAEAWWERVAVVAAYRDRWGIASEHVLGPRSDVASATQAAHRVRARRACLEALRLAGVTPDQPVPEVTRPNVETGREVTL
ncbi:MAG TPA: MobF family relaxase [Acidimicrobiales bacterium]|nr:MobF family relaxase [Acidimicrobiales bacterium]